MNDEFVVYAKIPEGLLVLDDPVVVDPLLHLLPPGTLDLVLAEEELEPKPSILHHGKSDCHHGTNPIAAIREIHFCLWRNIECSL